MRTTPTFLTALLLAGLLAAGCSSSSESGDDMAAGSATGSSGESAQDGGGTTAGTAGNMPEQLQVIDLRAAPGSAVIRTAELAVRVDDVRKAADEAGRLARAGGGGVEGEERSGDDSGSASISLRVTPDVFDETIAALAALGDERSRRLGSDDVTDQVVDLEARLATQRASVDRVRALLGEADALGEVVQIEAELTKRTADLEALQARLESLTARVDLSSITLRLDSEGGPVVGDALGFGDGVRAGWSALTETARVLAVTGGALLPFLPVLLVVGFFVWRARSRRTAVVAP